jgi:hypothetical protein
MSPASAPLWELQRKKNTRAKISPVCVYVLMRVRTIIIASRVVDENESINVKPHKYLKLVQDILSFSVGAIIP